MFRERKDDFMATNTLNRMDLKLGYTCNNNCLHCVVGDRRGQYKDRTTEEVKEILTTSHEEYNDVVLTGGEVTIRPDILEIIRHAASLNYIINIQSNARMFSYLKFCREVQDAAAGARIAFTLALLSSEEEIHNALTSSKSYKQVVSGISNLIEMGMEVNTNTVVTKINYRTLPATARLLIAMGINSYQFAFVHVCGNAEKNIDIILPRKSDAAPFIREGLQVGIDNNTRGVVEAFPYCFLRGGYEAYVTEKFTPDKVKLVDKPMVIDDFTTRRITIEKSKGPNCGRCLYYRFCEGPWIQYPAFYGWDEFIPIE